MSEETVYVASHTSGSDVYHTRKSCQYLPENKRTRDRGTVEAWGWRECEYCQGNLPNVTHEKGAGLRQRIQSGEVNPDDY